jgi:hypothetical protein
MGKNIDLSQPLSAEDRTWLEERGKYGDLRVADDLAAAANAPAPEAEPEAEPEETGGEDSETYGTWTKAQLQYELQTRDLAQSGTKAELVARLEEDDAAKLAVANDNQ